MIIDNKSELLMIMIGLEQVSEMVLDDERGQEWHKRGFMSLYNRVAEEYNGLVSDEDELLVEMLVEGY